MLGVSQSGRYQRDDILIAVSVNAVVGSRYVAAEEQRAVYRKRKRLRGFAAL